MRRPRSLLMGPGFASTCGRVEPLLPVGEPLILAEAIEPAEATASVATGNDEELPDHGYFLFLFFVGVRSLVGAPGKRIKYGGGLDRMPPICTTRAPRLLP